MSGLFGGGSSDKKKSNDGYIPPANQPPTSSTEVPDDFPAPGAVPVKKTPALVGGLDGYGDTPLAAQGMTWG